MKISFYQPSYCYYNAPKQVTQQKQVNIYAPSFTANPSCAYKDLVRVRPRKLACDVVSDVECKNILNRIYYYRDCNKNPLFDIALNRQKYPNVKPNEEGLLLYAGYDDLSNDMNRFLSRREMYRMNPKQAEDVVRVFDYSLKKLDEQYGKYSGFVYRQGFFPLGQHQYVSTTTDPVIAATLRGGIYLNKNLEFSIVKVKNGHKINEFQRKMGADYAEEEEEILMSRTARYREITDPQGQFLMLKNKFHKLLETYAHQKILPSKIRLFEEI